jgi:hypothetical protein
MGATPAAWTLAIALRTIAAASAVCVFMINSLPPDQSSEMLAFLTTAENMAESLVVAFEMSSGFPCQGSNPKFISFERSSASPSTPLVTEFI